MTITDAKKNFIVGEALALFLERSIGEVTVHDIALRASVGEATIYRYFSTKLNLVCAAATQLGSASVFFLSLSRKDRKTVGRFFNNMGPK